MTLNCVTEWIGLKGIGRILVKIQPRLWLLGKFLSYENTRSREYSDNSKVNSGSFQVCNVKGFCSETVRLKMPAEL